MDGGGSGVLGGIEEGQVAQKDEALLVYRFQALMAQGLIGNGQDFHAVLQHFVHNGMDAGKAIGSHDAALASILHVATPRTHGVNAAFDQE